MGRWLRSGPRARPGLGRDARWRKRVSGRLQSDRPTGRADILPESRPTGDRRWLRRPSPIYRFTRGHRRRRQCVPNRSPVRLVLGQTTRSLSFLPSILRVHLCQTGTFSIAGSRCFGGWRSSSQGSIGRRERWIGSNEDRSEGRRQATQYLGEWRGFTVNGERDAEPCVSAEWRDP
jgi:hypothetical protein